MIPRYQEVPVKKELRRGDEILREGRWEPIPSCFVGRNRTRAMGEDFRRDVGTLPLDYLSMIKTGERFYHDFFMYYNALCGMERNYHGLQRPFTDKKFDGIFPVWWVVEFGHYVEGEINAAVGKVVSADVFHGELCIHRMGMDVGKIIDK